MIKPQHVPKYPVLIADDNEDTLRLLRMICNEMGMTAETVTDGNAVRKNIESGKHYSLFILDLKMPGLGGEQLIPLIKKTDPDAMILVCTGIDSTDTVIDLMKLGIQDYIVKPVEIGLFQKSVLNAVELYYFRNQEKDLEERSASRLRHQLEWLTYKESRKKTGRDSTEKFTIDNLRTSLAQGGGIGSVISLVDVIKEVSPTEAGKVLVDQELFRLLLDNTQMARQSIEGMEKIVKLMNEDHRVERTEVAEFVKYLTKHLNPLHRYAQSRSLLISLPEFEQRLFFTVNQDLVRDAVEELILNAVKYAKKETEIGVFVHKSHGYIAFGVKNEVNPKETIPAEALKILTEPFFRVRPPLEEAIDIEKFGLGLGLTAVEFIAAKHGGVFSIENVTDHTGKYVADCVMAQILLPLDLT